MAKNKKHKKPKAKKPYITPKEGTKCRVKGCKDGKVIYHRNPLLKGFAKVLCTNKDCERTYICRSCGKKFGYHLTTSEQKDAN